jgi:hypothetical protein
MSVVARGRKGVVVSRRECALIAAAVAGAAAALGFRAGWLAAMAEWRQANDAAVSAARDAPTVPPPDRSEASDFSEWEQGAVPRDS